MRVGLGLVAASMLSLASGCAHLSTGAEPAMVEIATPVSAPPPLAKAAHHERWTRRKTLLAWGITVGAIGAALMIGGAAGYGAAVLNPHPGQAACRSCIPPVDTTASDASIDTLSVGAAHLGIGVALMVVGLTRPD
jgi:hypothetical protein